MPKESETKMLWMTQTQCNNDVVDDMPKDSETKMMLWMTQTQCNKNDAVDDMPKDTVKQRCSAMDDKPSAYL